MLAQCSAQANFFFPKSFLLRFFSLPKYDHFDYLLENVFSYHKWSSGI